MTVPLWPSDLPQSLHVEGFGLTQADGRLRTQNDTGPGKRRLLNSAAVTSVQALAIYTRDQLARFDRFWIEDLGSGVLPFLIRDQVLDGLPLTDESGNPLTDESDNPLLNESWWLVQFGAPPSRAAKSGLYFRLTLDLEVLP